MPSWKNTRTTGKGMPAFVMSGLYLNLQLLYQIIFQYP